MSDSNEAMIEQAQNESGIRAMLGNAANMLTEAWDHRYAVGTGMAGLGLLIPGGAANAAPVELSGPAVADTTTCAPGSTSEAGTNPDAVVAQPDSVLMYPGSVIFTNPTSNDSFPGATDATRSARETIYSVTSPAGGEVTFGMSDPHNFWIKAETGATGEYVGSVTICDGETGTTSTATETVDLEHVDYARVKKLRTFYSPRFKQIVHKAEFFNDNPLPMSIDTKFGPVNVKPDSAKVVTDPLYNARYTATVKTPDGGEAFAGHGRIHFKHKHHAKK